MSLNVSKARGYVLLSSGALAPTNSVRVSKARGYVLLSSGALAPVVPSVVVSKARGYVLLSSGVVLSADAGFGFVSILW